MDVFTHHHKGDRKLRKLRASFCLPTSPGDEKPRNDAVLDVDPTRLPHGSPAPGCPSPGAPCADLSLTCKWTERGRVYLLKIPPSKDRNSSPIPQLRR